jgi:hypothetical protein
MSGKKKVLILSFTAILSIIGIVLGAHIKTARASFQANNLIDNYIFENSGSMSAAQIDEFLNHNFPQSCISTNNGFSAPDPTGYSPSTGYTYGPNVSAGKVIYDAAQAYGINPQVILATLEKESSVVSGAASYHCQYINTSMGFDCPDGGSCPRNPATESGFSQQIIHAAWLLMFGEQHANGNYNWAVIKPGWDNSDDVGSCYSGPMTEGFYKRGSSSSCNQTTFYDGYASIDGTSVHMDTGATASLYWYTPHFHGNQLFVNIFESWFGATTGEGYSLVTSYRDNGDPRQWVVYHGMRHWIPNTDVLKAWGLDKVTLLQWDGAYLGSFPDGPTLSRLMRPSGTQDVYFVDAGRCFKVSGPKTLDAWGFNAAAIVDVSIALGQLPTNYGNLPYSLRSTSNATNIYTTDGGAKRRYGSPDIMAAWEGDSAPYITLSDDYFNAMGIGADITGIKITNGGKEYEVVAGQKLPLWSGTDPLYPGSALSVSSATANRLDSSAAASQFVRSPNSSTIYLVDSSTKHAIGTPQIAQAWAANSSPTVNIVTQGTLNLLTTGAPLNSYEGDVGGQLYLLDGRRIKIPSAIDPSYRTTGNVYSASSALMSLLPDGGSAANALKASNNPAVYLMDAGSLRHIRTPSELSLLSNNSFTSVSSYILTQFSSGATVGAYVTDGTNKYIIESGQKHPIDASAVANWNLINPDALSASTLTQFSTTSTLNNKLQNSGSYFMVRQGTAYGTTDANIAGIWGINDAPSMNTALIDEFLGHQMLTRIASSKLSGDSRLFIVDRGVLYRLYPNQAINLGVHGPFTAVDPTIFTVNDWVSAVVKDEGGTNYVIDGGKKRTVPAGVIRDQWTYGDYLNIPTMTNGFLNTLPTSIQIERAIKGSGPNVYSAEDFKKRWIQNSDIYNSKYAPYTNVSDALLNVLPDGTNL